MDTDTPDTPDPAPFVVDPRRLVVTVPDSRWTIQFTFQAADGPVAIDPVNRTVTAPDGYRLQPANWPGPTERVPR